MVNFNATKDEMQLIAKIARRALDYAKQDGLDIDYTEMEMDITACHCNGMPLDLEKLQDAEEFTFRHDVFGISRCIDRNTGEIGNCFVPRCAKPESAQLAN
jgi:hypothetical protein